MKKFRWLTIVLTLVLALSLVLTGCGGGGTNGDSTDDGGEQQGGEANPNAAPEGETQVQLTKRFRTAMEDALAADYADKIDAQNANVQEMLDTLKSHMSYRSTFKKDSVKGLEEVMVEFDNILPFRSEGSLVGPEAPATYDEAVTFIKEEFADYINDDTQATVDEALAGMQETYDQATFDAARRALWDEFECDVDTNTYWQGTADEDAADEGDAE